MQSSSAQTPFVSQSKMPTPSVLHPLLQHLLPSLLLGLEQRKHIVNSRYLEVEAHTKLPISQSKFSSTVEPRYITTLTKIWLLNRICCYKETLYGPG